MNRQTDTARVEENEHDPPAQQQPQLMTAKEVGVYFRIPAKKVYELAIPRVELSERRVRWLRSDLQAFVRQSRVEV